ncbi:hypothetical protein [Anaeromicropila herbilytica]|uniref:Uncharacterized protein n=1 Tax=Anaeromicropila herbilytica TaxID=2785025 RepID=A0A7R7EN88_9FIRM|nr:hypothetical protein [Anaeromicropila herbilytica]BCN31903.1 hypothetical protein bsdtb5_31980 [Anaeromicropila herbilytica]
MMYPFMQLDDNTEIVHSELQNDDNGEYVKVYIEKPVEGGFHSAVCYLPSYHWEEIIGFDKTEMEKYQELLESTAHLIIRFARQGGIGNASNF